MSNIRFAERMQSVKPSPTLAVTAKAAELRAKGKDIIGLGAGEPDFDTPEHIKQAAIRAIHDGFTKYTAVDGILGLKIAIIDKFQRDNGLDFQPEQILVSCGGKQSFFNLAQALINPGDEVVIPAPYWVSYPDMVLLAGGAPVFIETGMATRFKITPEQLDAAISDKTRLVVLNSPSNPSGMAYSKAELEALGEVLKRHPQVMIASDDMYEHILWNDEGFHNILDACPDLGERTIVLNGVSKAYAMTGWRIGYAAGPADLIRKMKVVQSQSTSNPASVSQVAAEEALNGDQGCVADMLREYRARHDYVVSALGKMSGVEVLAGDGTFYAFPSFQGTIDARDDISDDIELAAALLEQAGVALVPGSAFGAPGCGRISFATSMAVLEDAMGRLARFFG